MRRRGGAASLRVVLVVEDVLHGLVVALVGLLGRREVTVLPFIGYGTPDRVRARGGSFSAGPPTAPRPAIWSGPRVRPPRRGPPVAPPCRPPTNKARPVRGPLVGGGR